MCPTHGVWYPAEECKMSEIIKDYLGSHGINDVADVTVCDRLRKVTCLVTWEPNRYHWAAHVSSGSASGHHGSICLSDSTPRRRKFQTPKNRWLGVYTSLASTKGQKSSDQSLNVSKVHKTAHFPSQNYWSLVQSTLQPISNAKIFHFNWLPLSKTVLLCHCNLPHLWLSELIFEQNFISFIDLWIIMIYSMVWQPNRKLYYKTATTRYKSFCTK